MQSLEPSDTANAERLLYNGEEITLIKPSIDVLVSKVDSKYSLVVATAKRARAIVEGAPGLVETESKKPVTRALFELAAGKITYERTKTGIK